MIRDTLTQVDELHAIAKELIRKDVDDDIIIQELINCGVDAAYAEMIIGNVRKDERDRRDSFKLILMGTFCIIGGLMITYLSYRMAANRASLFFFIFWGVVVAGIGMLIRGFSLYRK